MWSELDKFPDNLNFYWSQNEISEVLQGDAWQGFVVIDFVTGKRKAVPGVVLSNSCDISQKNARDVPTNILFAPLIKLSDYIAVLERVGKTADQISSQLVEIRKQHVTSIFYLPECLAKYPESMILLHDIHAHPAKDFFANDRREIFKLNQYAFYIFLMKLSIHLCRFQEGVARFS